MTRLRGMLETMAHHLRQPMCLLASVTQGPKHAVPVPDGNMLNRGFWVVKPDAQLYKYYPSFLNTPNSFDSATMEQSLLNHVHDQGKGMSWARIPSGVAFNVLTSTRKYECSAINDDCFSSRRSRSAMSTRVYASLVAIMYLQE